MLRLIDCSSRTRTREKQRARERAREEKRKTFFALKAQKHATRENRFKATGKARVIESEQRLTIEGGGGRANEACSSHIKSVCQLDYIFDERTFPYDAQYLPGLLFSQSRTLFKCEEEETDQHPALFAEETNQVAFEGV